MQKFVNEPSEVVEDMLKGFVKAHKYIEFSETNQKVLKYKNKVKGKVGLVSGGGSGHEPAFIGYIGENMLDAVAVGEVFSSPPAVAFYDAFTQANVGSGVACLFGNYAGDNMNVKMAINMADDEGIEVKYVVATDDISSSPKETKEKRHGIAGGPLMWKTAGAKAAMGGTLEQVIEIAKKTVDNTRSICVGLSACTIPAVGHPNFSIEEGNYEFGIGHHGEPGMNIKKMTKTNMIVEEMMNKINEDMPIKENEKVVVIISGLGGTPLMEQYIVYHEVEKYLSTRKIKVIKSYVGNYVTSLDMNGIAVTILRVDQELTELIMYEASCPAFGK